MTKVVRHGKPSNAYLDTLRKPKKSDYDLLVKSCIEALVSGENDVIIGFSYVTKFPAGFPRGILEYKVDDKNVHRIKARKLLTWLHENGYTDATVEGLKQQRTAFSKFEKSLDLTLDDDQSLADNVKHPSSNF
jgi:hypothetical protein